MQTWSHFRGTDSPVRAWFSRIELNKDIHVFEHFRRNIHIPDKSYRFVGVPLHNAKIVYRMLYAVLRSVNIDTII